MGYTPNKKDFHIFSKEKTTELKTALLKELKKGASKSCLRIQAKGSDGLAIKSKWRKVRGYGRIFLLI